MNPTRLNGVVLFGTALLATAVFTPTASASPAGTQRFSVNISNLIDQSWFSQLWSFVTRSPTNPTDRIFNRVPQYVVTIDGNGSQVLSSASNANPTSVEINYNSATLQVTVNGAVLQGSLSVTGAPEKTMWSVALDESGYAVVTVVTTSNGVTETFKFNVVKTGKKTIGGFGGAEPPAGVGSTGGSGSGSSLAYIFAFPGSEGVKQGRVVLGPAIVIREELSWTKF